MDHPKTGVKQLRSLEPPFNRPMVELPRPLRAVIKSKRYIPVLFPSLQIQMQNQYQRRKVSSRIKYTVNLDSANSRAVLDLNAAVAEFKKHYLLFAKNNDKFITIAEADLENALSNAASVQSVSESAKVFGKKVMTVMHVTEKKNGLSKAKWTIRVGEFCSKLYPVARISIQLAGVAGDV